MKPKKPKPELVTEDTTTPNLLQSSSSTTSTPKLLDTQAPPQPIPTTNLLQDTTAEEFQISQDYASPINPNRSRFSNAIKQQCWDKADEVNGRDPERWRRDAVGNIVFRKLVACPGCLCFDYDHILPVSKGGKKRLENCQVLQATANRGKGDQTDLSRVDLLRMSSFCLVEDRDMDLLERAAYGNIRRAPNFGGCKIQ